MKTLVIFSKDWADEFQVQSFKIYDESTEEVTKILLEEIVGKITYFGTNQWWEEDEVQLSDFKIREITDEEATVISSLIGMNFGTASDLL